MDGTHAETPRVTYGNHGAFPGMSRILKLWDIESGQLVATFSVEAPIYGCDLSTRGTTTIAAGDQSGGVYFLRLRDPKARPLR